MKLVFQRPLWLEITAFTAAMLGFAGHLLGLWRFSVGVGLNLKITILEGLVYACSWVVSSGSSISAHLRETLHVFRMFQMLPRWFQLWYYMSGCLEFVASTALFVVAVMLWHKKKSAVRLFYAVVGVSIAVHLMNIASSMMISESLGIMKMVLDVPFVIIKIALVLIVFSADKSVMGTHAKDRVNFSVTKGL